jgi:hypothetical protein
MLGDKDMDEGKGFFDGCPVLTEGNADDELVPAMLSDVGEAICEPIGELVPLEGGL